MIIFNQQKNNNFVSENRIIYNEVAGANAEASSEKPPLPTDTIKKMAMYKARKNLYEDWGNTVMDTLGKQEDNLEKHNLDSSKVKSPADAYKMLQKLMVVMKKSWENEQLKIAKEEGGVIDLGTYEYKFFVNPAPCKPLNAKEQAFLSSNGARMPKSQIAEYQNLAMDLQMELAINGEAAFKKKAEKAGVDMSKAQAQRDFDFNQEESRHVYKLAKKK